MTTSHESARNRVNIYNIAFNSDRSFFTVCMDDGLRIYQTDPFDLYQALYLDECGSVKVAEQLDESCAVLMVAGGSKPATSSNMARLYNFITNTFGVWITVPSPILNVLISDDKIVLVQEREVQVYDVALFPLTKADRGVTYSTGINPEGLCQMSRGQAQYQLLCFPAQIKGAVKIVGSSGTGSSVHSTHGIIRAHQSDLRCMCLSQDATLLATASVTGTLIRVWDTRTKLKIMEFRRGLDAAVIYDIDISADNQFMGCVSDKGTVHVFALEQQQLNMTSNLSGLGPRSGYTDSVWGMAQFSLHELGKCKITLLVDCCVIVVTNDGRYFKYQFAPDGHKSTCHKTGYYLYVDKALAGEEDQLEEKTNRRTDLDVGLANIDLAL